MKPNQEDIELVARLSWRLGIVPQADEKAMVMLCGRAATGKSSLINSLCGMPVLPVGTSGMNKVPSPFLTVVEVVSEEDFTSLSADYPCSPGVTKSHWLTESSNLAGTHQVAVQGHEFLDSRYHCFDEFSALLAEHEAEVCVVVVSAAALPLSRATRPLCVDMVLLEVTEPDSMVTWKLELLDSLRRACDVTLLLTEAGKHHADHLQSTLQLLETAADPTKRRQAASPSSRGLTGGLSMSNASWARDLVVDAVLDYVTATIPSPLRRPMLQTIKNKVKQMDLTQILSLQQQQPSSKPAVKELAVVLTKLDLSQGSARVSETGLRTFSISVPYERLQHVLDLLPARFHKEAKKRLSTAETFDLHDLEVYLQQVTIQAMTDKSDGTAFLQQVKQLLEALPQASWSTDLVQWLGIDAPTLSQQEHAALLRLVRRHTGTDSKL